MKTSYAIGVVIGGIIVVAVTLCIETWLLGIILPWFGVNLSFGQNFAIIVLANLIFKSNGSSK